MRLVTKKTTLEEFSNSRDWLIKHSTTGTLHRVVIRKFGPANSELWYVYSKQRTSCIVEDYTQRSLLELSRLLNILQTGSFNFNW